MARITVEDCLEQVENRFVLIKLATNRSRDLREGERRLFQSQNKEIVQALREIAEGCVNLDDESRVALSGRLLKSSNRFDR